MALIPGTIPLTGTIAPTDDTDTFAITDPIYAIDGLRNVDDDIARNAIPEARRRSGMLVGTQDTGIYWKLLPAPWSYDNEDWEFFLGESGEDSDWIILSPESLAMGVDGSILPHVDANNDIGETGLEFKDLHLSGTANVNDISISNSVIFENSGFSNSIISDSLSDNRIHVLQNSSGIIAHISDIPAAQSLQNVLDVGNTSSQTSGPNFANFGVQPNVRFLEMSDGVFGTNFIELAASQIAQIVEIATGELYFKDIEFNHIHEFLQNNVGLQRGIFNNGLTGFIIKDEIGEKGMTYDDDYSLNFVDRSLIDKEYVDKSIYELSDTIQTIDATQTTIGTSIPVGNNQLIEFNAKIVSLQSGGIAGTTGDSKVITITGAIKNIAGITTLIGSNTTITGPTDIGASLWLADIIANDISDILQIRVTGEVNKNIEWNVKISTIKHEF